MNVLEFRKKVDHVIYMRWRKTNRKFMTLFYTKLHHIWFKENES